MSRRPDSTGIPAHHDSPIDINKGHGLHVTLGRTLRIEAIIDIDASPYKK